MDFNKGSVSRVYLKMLGTVVDLERQGLTLSEGMPLIVWDEDIEQRAIAHHDQEYGWYAEFG